MTQTTIATPLAPARKGLAIKPKFLIGTLVIVGAILYLAISSMISNAQYFLTVSELHAKGAPMIDRAVRVSGIVIGDSIVYHADRLHLTFTVVDDLKTRSHPLNVEYTGAKPDLMKDEAQAIMEGKLRPDGTFEASTLLLKCPTKYEDEESAKSTPAAPTAKP